MDKLHEIKNLKFEDNWLLIDIDGEIHKVDLSKVSPTLLNASEIEKMTYEISPSGYGIHWPLLDEDLSADGLLGIVHRPEVQTLGA